MPGGPRRHSGPSGSLWQIWPRTGRGPRHENRPLLIRQAGQHRGNLLDSSMLTSIWLINSQSVERPSSATKLSRDNLDEMAHCHTKIILKVLTISWEASAPPKATRCCCWPLWTASVWPSDCCRSRSMAASQRPSPTNACTRCSLKRRDFAMTKRRRSARRSATVTTRPIRMAGRA